MTAQLLIGLSALGELSVVLVWLSMSMAAIEIVAGGSLIASIVRWVTETVVIAVWTVLTVAFGLLAYAIGRFWQEDDDE